MASDKIRPKVPGVAGSAVAGGDFVRSLERGLAVIRAFDAEHPKLSLSEVAAITGGTLALPDIGAARAAVPAAKRFRRAGNAGGVVLHLEDAALASRSQRIRIPSQLWVAPAIRNSRS